MTDPNMTPEQRRAAVRGLPGAAPQGQVLPTGPQAQAKAQALAKKSAMKNLAVAGAAGTVGFFLLGPVGAAIGAAGGYGFMWIKQHGLPGAGG